MESEDRTKPRETRTLAAQVKRRRLSSGQLAAYLEKHHGIACAHEAIGRLLRGDETALQPRLVAEIEAILKAMPPAPRVTSKGSQLSRIEITEAMREELDEGFARTGARPALIVRTRPPELDALTTNKISCWRTGRTKQADPHEWTYVLNALKNRQ